MDTKTILNDATARMQKAVDFLEESLSNIRAGKASINVLNGVFVDKEVARNIGLCILCIDAAIGVESHRECVTHLLAECRYGFPLLATRNGDKYKWLTLELLDDILLYACQLCTARRTPSSPEVQQYNLALQVCKFDSRAIEHLHLESWSLLTILNDSCLLWGWSIILRLSGE